jgi:hypothetical protein
MRLRIPGIMAMCFIIAVLAAFMTGCETNTDQSDNSGDTNNVSTNIVTSFTTADLEGIWDLMLVGKITAMTAGIVIDSHGNVTGLSGPANVTGVTGSFYVGTDGRVVNGAVRYQASVTNGVMANCNIYLQGKFNSAKSISGNQTYGWTTTIGSGYDTGTFTMSR